MLRWPPKDPDEVLDYDVKWAKRLAGDTIATSVFTVAKGTVTVDDSDIVVDPVKGYLAVVWLSGGTLNETCEILNHIVTAGGREMEQTVSLPIKAK